MFVFVFVFACVSILCLVLFFFLLFLCISQFGLFSIRCVQLIENNKKKKREKVTQRTKLNRIGMKERRSEWWHGRQVAKKIHRTYIPFCLSLRAMSFDLCFYLAHLPFPFFFAAMPIPNCQTINEQRRRLLFLVCECICFCLFE